MPHSVDLPIFSSNYDPGGQAPNPLCIVSAHSGRHYPKEFLDKVTLAEYQLRYFEDAYIHDLITPTTQNLALTYLTANYPRSFVDLNRDISEIDSDLFIACPDDFVPMRSEKVQAGYGVIPSRFFNQPLYKGKYDYDYYRHRLTSYYLPFHHKINQIITSLHNQFGTCLLLDCHSMPSMIMSAKTNSDSHPHAHQKTGFPDFVIGTLNGQSCHPKIAKIILQYLRDLGFHAVSNKPYAGGYITQNYANPDHNISVVQIEINRQLYLNELNLQKKTRFNELNSVYSGLFKILIDLMTEFA